MFLARVLGNLTASVLVDGMQGVPLLLVRAEKVNGSLTGPLLVAADSTYQAGTGQLVYLVDGREAGFPLPVDTVPADITIVGLVDAVDAERAAP
jgi:microcompartment protein CcmK/EutM